MSNTTEEEVMADMMEVGVRVRRGKDWALPDYFGTGHSTHKILGTVVEKGSVVGEWIVKWDNIDAKYYHRMGCDGKYDLTIINFVKPIATFVKPVPTLGSNLFSGKKFSDFKIICDGKTIHCHKNVLGTQSDVFETMFFNMDMNEPKSGEFEIKDFNVAEHYGNIDIFP